jgi:hypothetical protein
VGVVRVRRRRAWILLAALFSLILPSVLGAQQPISVQPRRDLSFGDVIAGFPTTVSRLDNANSGWYEIRGERQAEVVLTFALPSDLVGILGATLPIEFGANDGGVASVPAPGSQVGFDPRVPLTRELSASGRAFVWLGGTVRPATNQASGLYQAPVTLTVAYTGN